MTRVVLDRSFEPLCLALRRGAVNAREIASYCSDDTEPERVLEFLAERGILVRHGRDDGQELEILPEPAAPAARAGNSRGGWPEFSYWQPAAVHPDDLAQTAELRSVRILLVGGCVLQFAENTLVRSGLRHGLNILTRHEWPTARGGLQRIISEWQPDVTILQPSIQPVLSGLWDHGVFVDETERQRRLRILVRAMQGFVHDFARALDGGLGLVHNVAPPSVSPFGRADFTIVTNFRRITSEVNLALDDAVREHPNLRIVDEEQFVARSGSGSILDDLVFPFGHHGGRPNLDIDCPNQLPELSELLVSEYLAAFIAYHGLEQIKLIIADLDGVLWPGIAADDGFEWVHSDTTKRWTHVGLHQALRILKARGILLASCSKGTESLTLDAWDRADHDDLLRPADFVLHRIGWSLKSEVIPEMCRTLSVSPRDVLVLDDHPVERKRD